MRLKIVNMVLQLSANMKQIRRTDANKFKSIFNFFFHVYTYNCNLILVGFGLISWLNCL